MRSMNGCDDQASMLMVAPTITEAAVAIGRQGDRSTLAERLQDREVPSTREALSTITIEGGFPPA